MDVIRKPWRLQNPKPYQYDEGLYEDCEEKEFVEESDEELTSLNEDDELSTNLEEEE